MRKLLFIVLFGFIVAGANAKNSDGSVNDDYSAMYHLRQNFDMQCMALDRISAIKGACFWLKVKLFSVSFKTSLIIEHRVPDLLIQSGTGQRDSPVEPFNIYQDLNEGFSKMLLWGMGFFDSDVNSAMRSNKTRGGTRSGGNKQRNNGRGNTDNLNFYDVSIIGNPYLPLYELTLETALDSLEIGSSCKSDVTAFQPYYMSMSDPEWRWGLLERGASLWDTFSGIITGTRHLNNTTFDFSLADPVGSLKGIGKQLRSGRAGVYWGYVYPRMGFIKNQSQYRSAAVTAFRATDLATNWNGLHIPQGSWPPSKPNKRKRKVWPIAKVSEDDDKHAFQLNYPQVKKSCYRFPDKKFDENVLVTDMTAASDNMLTQENNYIWTLWRTYKCCKKAGNVYLGKVEW